MRTAFLLLLLLAVPTVRADGNPAAVQVDFGDKGLTGIRCGGEDVDWPASKRNKVDNLAGLVAHRELKRCGWAESATP